MSALPFALRRPWLLVRDLLVDRDSPDLDRLRALREPDRFLWAILPHAARTFSACIAMLPARSAKAAAVGYLYCRVLDTYEDLHPDPVEREKALRAFAARLAKDPPAAAPPIPPGNARDARDRGHLLLVERCELVDRVFVTLTAEQRAVIRDLVRSMADGMCWSSRTFREQGGVLRSEEQLAQYCRNVLGFPVVFTLRLLQGGELPPALYEDAMTVGEMVQLANVTRDIEKDLRRGVAYHPRLAPLLYGPADPQCVRAVREELLLFALRRASAYRRMVEAVDLPRLSLARASAVLMLLFTNRYFRSCARRVGRPGWRGPEHAVGLLICMLPAVGSRRWTRRVVRRIEHDFLHAAARRRSGAHGPAAAGP
ncbi:MAG: squalene/phytoene synthase family protein [Planctomycetota bacterium]|jgi:phytoene/squalene synthetase